MPFNKLQILLLDNNINVLDVYYDLPEHINIINNVNYYKERVEMTPRNISRLIPMLLITVVIVNPWFYMKWVELGMYAYWRILWIVPVCMN